jgi:hypothetical protein
MTGAGQWVAIITVGGAGMTSLVTSATPGHNQAPPELPGHPDTGKH